MVMKAILLVGLVVLALQQTDIKLETEETKATSVDQTVSAPVMPIQSAMQVLSSMSYSQLISRFKLELLAVALVILYITNFTIGKRKNKDIAYNWLRAVEPTLSHNFAMVGFEEHRENKYMLEESPHEFIFYASGRDNLQFAQFGLEMQNREDVITNYLLGLFSPMKDLITVDIPINNTLPLILYILKKRDVKNVKAKSKDMQVTKEFKIANFPDTMVILGENVESVDQIIDNQVIKMIAELQGVFNSLHYTDQQVYNNSPGHLRVLLNFSKEGEKNELAIKLVLYLVDRIAALKLPQGVKVKSEKAREVFAAAKEKEQQEKIKEELQKEKAEKKKQEELRIKSLPPEKRQREQEKEKKREMKEFMKSRTVRM